LRDAIVFSGWTWQAFNIPERLALSLAHAGAHVLYCENPKSFAREPVRFLNQRTRNVVVYKLAHISHRLNGVEFVAALQAKMLVNQIERQARKLKLHRPLFFYPHGFSSFTIAREMKRRGYDLVHMCIDYHIEEQIQHIQRSDITLTIIEAAYVELCARFGSKIHRLREFGPISIPVDTPLQPSRLLPSEALKVPSPRLVYLGSVDGRVNLELIRELLQSHPEWHFVAFGSKDRVGLPNSHFLPWVPATEWSKLLGPGTIGFMPYDISIPKNLHCAPLKLFDYFAVGLPIASVPIVYVRDYPDLVYTGGTVGELATAVERALEEPFDSPKKLRRRALVSRHNRDTMARILAPLLDEGAAFPPIYWAEDEDAKPQNLSRELGS
jgi:hypothetical protein